MSPKVAISLLTCSVCGAKEKRGGPVFFYRYYPELPKDPVFCSSGCANKFEGDR